jgi:5-methylcytosine-specific restriction endonuclease McrA
MPIDRKSLRSFNPATFAKKKIPTALKEQLWIQKCGKVFECECHINWCVNTINVFNFHVGHDIPQSKGGSLELSNLFPICDRCNYSMSNKYSIKKWNKLCGV